MVKSASDSLLEEDCSGERKPKTLLAKTPSNPILVKNSEPLLVYLVRDFWILRRSSAKDSWSTTRDLFFRSFFSAESETVFYFISRFLVSRRLIVPEKMSVKEYLDKHMLSRKIEEAINAAVRAKALDPVLFIVRSLSIIISFCSVICIFRILVRIHCHVLVNFSRIIWRNPFPVQSRR